MRALRAQVADDILGNHHLQVVHLGLGLQPRAMFTASPMTVRSSFSKDPKFPSITWPLAMPMPFRILGLPLAYISRLNPFTAGSRWMSRNSVGITPRTRSNRSEGLLVKMESGECEEADDANDARKLPVRA